MSRIGASAITSVGDQPWLDDPGYRIEHGLALTFALFGSRGRAVQNFLHGTWLGHPLHPVLTSLPLGAWTAALAADATDVLSPGAGRASLRPVAQFAVGAGVVGGLGAAVTGLTDWQHTQDAPRRVGLVHGLLNTAALGCNIYSWRQRRSGHQSRARVASVAGYGLVAAASYLGGHLVFGDRIGVDHTHHHHRTSNTSSGSGSGSGSGDGGGYVAVLAAQDLPEDSPRLVDYDGTPIVLIRHHNIVRALGQSCPHLGAPLQQGWIYRDTLVCPWHGSRFNVHTGQVTGGPATAPLPRYATRILGGQIEVRALGAPTIPAAAPTDPAAAPPRPDDLSGDAPIDAGGRHAS